MPFPTGIFASQVCFPQKPKKKLYQYTVVVWVLVFKTIAETIVIVCVCVCRVPSSHCSQNWPGKWEWGKKLLGSNDRIATSAASSLALLMYWPSYQYRAAQRRGPRLTVADHAVRPPRLSDTIWNSGAGSSCFVQCSSSIFCQLGIAPGVPEAGVDIVTRNRGWFAFFDIKIEKDGRSGRRREDTIVAFSTKMDMIGR